MHIVPKRKFSENLLRNQKRNWIGNCWRWWSGTNNEHWWTSWKRKDRKRLRKRWLWPNFFNLIYRMISRNWSNLNNFHLNKKSITLFNMHKWTKNTLHVKQKIITKKKALQKWIKIQINLKKIQIKFYDIKHLNKNKLWL